MRKTFSKNSFKITLVSVSFLIMVMSFLGINSYAAKSLIPIGQTTGILLHSDGVVITDFSDDNGESPARKYGLQIGDFIKTVNGVVITDRKSLSDVLKSCSKSDISLTIIRNNQQMNFVVNSIYDSKTDSYILGIKAKDSIAGIGTITYIDPTTGEYGALGHSITDPESSDFNIYSKGILVPSTITSVEKGKKGDPGELLGSFEMNNSQGSVRKNTDCGIFGKIFDINELCKMQAMETAEVSEVEIGKAYILSNISGKEVRKYDIKITKVSNDSTDNRQLMIEVTDKKLLEQTGGIVQGMSGSPIIQNGKIVGAVTHVLINDPTRGYGIFVDTMLNKAA